MIECLYSRDGRAHALPFTVTRDHAARIIRQCRRVAGLRLQHEHWNGGRGYNFYDPAGGGYCTVIIK